MNNSSQEEDEILIKEHTTVLTQPNFAPWSQTQPESYPADEDPPFFDVKTIRERRRRRQEMQQNIFSPNISSPDEDEPRENEFALLEAMLESQDSPTKEEDPNKTETSDMKGSAAEELFSNQGNSTAVLSSPEESCAMENEPTAKKSSVEHPVASVRPPTTDQAFETRARESSVDKERDFADDSRGGACQVPVGEPPEALSPARAPPRRRGFQQRPAVSTVPTFLVNTSSASSVLEKSRRFVQSQTAKTNRKKPSETAPKKKVSGTVAVSNPKSLIGTR